MPVIEMLSVSKIFGFADATTVALDDVDLTIESGEFVVIMGPSGSGKTTLMNVIGLLDQATHGSYRLDGSEVASLSSRQKAKIRRDQIGFIFQSYNLLPRLNIMENVALPLTYKGILGGKRLEKAHSLLESLGIGDRSYYKPNQLSGGQTQRAAIARALINEPSIILADEPTGNLDSHSAQIVMQTLSDIHALGNTIIMVTHNPDLARWGDRVINMLDGKIVSDSAIEIKLESPKPAKHSKAKKRKNTKKTAKESR